MNVRSPRLGAVALTAAVLVGGPLPAQTLAPACTSQALAQDACQKAADLFAFLAPQLAASIAGGNATLGQGGNLGGLGRFSLGVRVTGLRGELPDLRSVQVQAGPAQASTFAVDEQVFRLPQVDVGIGLFRGFPLALTNVGGVDLLLSASWLPEVERGDLELRASDGQFRVGGGVRVGILQESITVPGVSVTYLRRSLPSANVTARPGNDTLSVLGAGITVDSWRLVASKRLLAFGLAAGIGQDRSDAETSVSATVNEGPMRVVMSTPQPFSQTMTRTNMFANLSLNLAVLRLVGEIGQVSGGDAPTLNSFQGTSAAASRLYGSAGLRLGF